MTTFQYIQSDYKKYRKYGASFLVILLFTQGFWATFQYRIAHFVFCNITWQPFRFVFKTILFLWQKVIEITTGISIPASVQIGHSFYIGHFGGIIFNKDAIIGNDCNVAQNVTIGVSGLGEDRGVPIIGNNVYIAANSVVAGKIIIEAHQDGIKVTYADNYVSVGQAQTENTFFIPNEDLSVEFNLDKKTNQMTMRFYENGFWSFDAWRSDSK